VKLLRGESAPADGAPEKPEGFVAAVMENLEQALKMVTSIKKAPK